MRPNYRPYEFNQTTLVAICHADQLVKGSFEHTLHYLIEHTLDLSSFDSRYRNSETGASAYHPKVLLKIILYAYYLGITSSRRIAELCERHLTFMALSAQSTPHFTTIASFVTNDPQAIESLFLEILLVCEQEGLIGRDFFAADGCKQSSNASKEWSGTREELTQKKEKLEKKIHQLLQQHRETDAAEAEGILSEEDQKRLDTLIEKAKKIKTFLRENREKRGSTGKPIKSNITDNESAKLKGSHGVEQGHNAVANVDAKHQVIVAAKAFGSGNEKAQLQPILEETRENFQQIEKSEDILKEVKQLTDAGFHSSKNVSYLEEQGIDGYIPDPNFRKRDEKFQEADRFKQREDKYRNKKFGTQDFIFDPEQNRCWCPAGKEMWLKNAKAMKQGYLAVQFQGSAIECRNCQLRKNCLRSEDQKTARQVCFFQGKANEDENHIERMKRKLETVEGKRIYSKRLGIVEPIFANITSTLRLNRFSVRGENKVNAQWNLYAIVHNIGKIQKYGKLAA